MGWRDILKKSLKKDPRYKEMETEMKMQKMIEERQKSSNERELERFYEEEREKSIKKNLEEFREKQKKETWQGDQILNTKNIFKGHKNIMDQDKNVLDNGRGILNDKSLFHMGKGMSKHKGGMFFK